MDHAAGGLASSFSQLKLGGTHGGGGQRPAARPALGEQGVNGTGANSVPVAAKGKQRASRWGPPPETVAAVGAGVVETSTIQQLPGGKGWPGAATLPPPPSPNHHQQFKSFQFHPVQNKLRADTMGAMQRLCPAHR